MKIAAEYAKKMTREEYLDLLGLDEGPGYMTRSDIVEIAEDAIKFADSHPLNPWKSVKEELPRENLFLRDIRGDVFVAEYYYCNSDWWDVRGESCREDEIRDQYTHFMPTPELPKEDTK